MKLTLAKPAWLGALKGSPIHHAALLGGFALIAALALASADVATKGPIKARAQDDLNAALSQVIPDALHDNDLLGDKLSLLLANGQEREVFRALKGGQVMAVAYQLEGEGYGGTIYLLMGVDAEGRILGVRVLAHHETPGLGDKVETGKSKWVLSFNDRSLADPGESGWAVKKDGGQFDQFSGATITPRAVVKAVHQGLKFFAAHKDKLLAPSKQSSGAGA